MIVGLLLAVGLVAAWLVVRRRDRGVRATMQAAAKRLGGALDPACEDARCPAILTEIGGHLLRASGWPLEGEASGADVPPYLEVCTPVEGVASPILVVRRSVLSRLLPLLREDLRQTADADIPAEGISVFGAHHAPWAPPLFEKHRSWILLEIDDRMLRVLTCDPQDGGLDAESVERTVRAFAASVTRILVAAGVTGPRHPR